MAAEQVTSRGTPIDPNAEKHSVALGSALAAVFLTVIKLAVGITTGSLGILSEAAHSGLDLVATVVTLVAVRLSGKPADNQHTYGHGKIENLSALFETVLLLVTCVWIIYEAIQRLFFKNVAVELSIWAFIIVIAAIVIDWTRSRALWRVAKKYDSQALEADALHFSTDIWSSTVVLVGLVCVVISKVFQIEWLAKADAVAALGVSGIVIYISLSLGKRTITALLDGVPAGFHDEVIAAVHVPGVTEVRRVRVRRSGPEAFADITLAVTSDVSLVRAHDIADAAEQAVKKLMPGADVVVHIDPDSTTYDDIVTTVRVLAGQRGLAAHGVRIYEIADQHELELHLEVPPELTLGEAHTLASGFERALRERVHNLRSIVTHIEPTGDGVAMRSAVRVNEKLVLDIVQAMPIKLGVDCKPHNISIHRVGSELALSFHCTLDSGTSLSDVHAFTERAEHHIRTAAPDVARILIHTEPEKTAKSS
jgi:cation diffusion facilitator family transporter